MNDVDERLARLLDDAVPRPPRELDGAEIRNARPRRRIVRIAAPALAAAVVVAVAVVAVVVIRPASDKNGVGSGRPTPTPPTATGSSPRDQTLAAVERLLAAAPVVPNTYQVTQPPAKELRHPMSRSSGNLVDRARWWTGHGTVSAALNYFANHLPDGLGESGSGSGSGPGERSIEGLTFDATGPDWSKPTIYANLELDIEAVQLGDRVGIRVDAQAIWLPQRTSAEQIPKDVSSVDVVVTRTDRAPTVRRTLGPAKARRVGAAINKLPVDSGAIRHCPAGTGAVDRLTFHAGPRTITVVVEADGCATVTITADGAPQPALDGGWTLNHAITKALGLPRNYGLRR